MKKRFSLAALAAVLACALGLTAATAASVDVKDQITQKADATFTQPASNTDQEARTTAANTPRLQSPQQAFRDGSAQNVAIEKQQANNRALQKSLLSGASQVIQTGLTQGFVDDRASGETVLAKSGDGAANIGITKLDAQVARQTDVSTKHQIDGVTFVKASTSVREGYAVATSTSFGNGTNQTLLIKPTR